MTFDKFVELLHLARFANDSKIIFADEDGAENYVLANSCARITLTNSDGIIIGDYFGKDFK